MNTYLVTAHYTASSMQGMIQNPHNREDASRSLLGKLDIELSSVHMTHGGKIYMVCRGTDDAIGSMAMVVMATGSIDNPTIEQLVSAEQQMQFMEKAQQVTNAYKPANAG